MEVGSCKHFRGIQHKTCRLELNWREITGGSDTGIVARMPCFANHQGDACCEEYEEPTAEELAEQRRRLEHSLDCLRRNVSSCCEASLDESQVLPSGHGPRYCSKCGKVAFMV